MLTLILWLPFISFITLFLLGSNLGQSGSCFISCFLLGASLILTWVVTFSYFYYSTEEVMFLWSWLGLGDLEVEVSLMGDHLSCSMLTIVVLVSFLVHLYSTSYMWGDPHLPSFMSYLSLFTFFMVLLVQAGNLLVLFVGWEGVGLCSYLLMNFWFTSVLANSSAIKAMIVNSVGDLGLIIAMVLIWSQVGSLNWAFLPLLKESPQITLLCSFLLLLGVMGKSAQLGLHTWLPDAMEGPTPVSALIHAATMVTAGVFLMLSTAVIFENSSVGLLITLLLGSLTALFAASVGLAQTDMKKVMAYSTTSQLGYMVASCGLAQFSLGLSHLINHAYFKALLFLSAGAIIHANLDQQDMSKFGSFWKQSPIAYLGMMIGSLSLMGFPFTTGFYSKDLIMETSFYQPSLTAIAILLTAAASLTAAYSAKVMVLSFLGKPLFSSSSIPLHDSNNWFIFIPLISLSIGSLTVGYLLQSLMSFPLSHPLLSSMMKGIPLMVSIGGVCTSIIVCWMWLPLFKAPLFSTISSFLFSAWYFNQVVNNLLSKTVWKISYHLTYKLVDSGWIEMGLPFSLKYTALSSTGIISSTQSGLLYNSILFLVLFFSMMVNLIY